MPKLILSIFRFLYMFRVVSRAVSGRSMPLLLALRTLEPHLQWHMQFLLVANHCRTIPIFQVAVVLLEPLEDHDEFFILHPEPPRKSRGRGRGRGEAGRGAGGAARGGGVEPAAAPRGRGRGVGVRGGARGRGRGRGDVDAAQLEDEAKTESDLADEDDDDDDDSGDGEGSESSSPGEDPTINQSPWSIYKFLHIETYNYI